MAKKKESNGSNKKKGNKSKMMNKLRIQKSGAGNVKEPKENPFESIWSRRKFNILGQKRKGGETEKRRVGLSRSLAVQKRQKTLLKEYLQNSKSSVFMDKRIGENDEGLGEFDKAILRSQREIQTKLKRKRQYNLSDEEEDDIHIGEGAYFPERDDYEDEDPPDDEEDGQSIGIKNYQNRSQHDANEEEGGIDLLPQENRHKSKKEVMDDIISKSKFFKAQKTKEKEENEKLIEQLDMDFTSLLQSGVLSTLTQPGKITAVIANNLSNDNSMKSEEKPNQYDELLSELAFDIRARPSSRTKTAEELAQAEKERLEQLEAERQKRMAAAEDSGDEGANSGEDDEPDECLNLVSGDDPGNSVSNDSKSRSKVSWIDEILRRDKCKDSSDNPSSSGNSESDDDEEEEEDEEEETNGYDQDNDEVGRAQSLKDWEQSDDEYAEDQDEEDLVVEGSENVKVNGQSISIRNDDLPYTIDAPRNFEELSALLENRSDDQIVEAIKRIRSYNSISITQENRKKIQGFYGLLLQYFAVLASKKPLNLTVPNLLVKPLMEMSTEIPYYAAICARHRLLRIRTLFCDDLKNTGKSSWPSLKTLCLLRLWCMIFPCSDFRHAVITPSILLMSEYLMRCSIISGRDIAIGSFLCSMMLSINKQSKRYCPEAITFIQTMLMAALSNKQIVESSQLYHLMELKTSTPFLRLEGYVDEIRPLNFLSLMDLPDDSLYFTSDIFKASLLSALVGNLKGYVDVYQDLKSFPEIFSPFTKVLYELAAEERIPEKLKTEINDISSCIENKCHELHAIRQPLRYQKVKIIKTLVPKFEEKFVKGRDYDPDRERAERKKLKKRLKQEAKGAARELRKDNQFLLEVKEKQRAEMYREKVERYNKDKAFLEEQEHAFKSGQLGKSRRRRR